MLPRIDHRWLNIGALVHTTMKSTTAFSITALSIALISVSLINVMQTASALKHDLHAGLMAHWKFDKAKGTTAKDSSGNGNAGTLVNDPSWLARNQCAAGKSCLSFDGADDRVSVPNSSSLNIERALTVAAWINLKDIPPSSQEQNINNFPAVITKGPTNTQYIIFVYGVAGSASGTSPLTFRINTGIDNPTSRSQLVLHEVNSTSNVVFGRWMHVAGVYDGAVMKIYVNGVLEAYKPTSGRIATGTSPLTIGAGGNDLYTDIVPTPFVNQWHGLIDEVSIYNRALSKSEVQSIYRNSPPHA